jgi:DNA-binding NtrC family response regulator
MLTTGSGPATVLLTLKEAEQRHVLGVVDHAGGNRQKAAEILGISERHLYRLLKKIKDGGGAQ